jgi:uncharacterized protein (TIGR02453 family)
MLQNKTLQFLKDLKKNNNREWFAEHKDNYENAKADFELLIEHLISSLSKVDKRLESNTPKDCIFRIYRDVRFSKNKEPYKANFGASIKPGGKKSVACGFYLHIEPEGGWGSFVGGGYYMPEAALLRKIRQEIEYNHEEFIKLLKDKNFKKHFGTLEQEHTLTRVPKGFDPEHPAAEFLKYTSFIASEPLTAAQLKSKDFIKTCTASYQAMLPFLDFLNRVND